MQTKVLTATASGGNPSAYLFTWNNTLGTGAVKTITPDLTTQYKVVISDGCTVNNDSEFVTITVRPDLEITTRSDTTICFGNTVQLPANVTGGFSANHLITWNNSLGIGQPKMVSPLTTTIYRVILSDNCTVRPDTDFVTITVRPPLSVTPRSDTTICKGQSVTLFANASGGLASDRFLSWNQGLGTGSSFIITPDTTKTYRVILSDNCSPSDTDFVTITVRPSLQLSLTADSTICKGQTKVLTASAIGGNASTYIFTWNNNLGTGLIKTITPDSTRQYKVILSDGCTVNNDSEFVTITVRPALDVTTRFDTIICFGNTVELRTTAIGGYTPNHLMTWDHGLGTGAPKFVNPPVTTTYRVVLTDNCTVKADTDFVTVFVRSPLNVLTRADTTICKDQPVQLYVDGTGGDSLAYTFEWDHGAGNGNYVVQTPQTSTSYKVILTDNCTLFSDSDFVNITVRPALDVTVNSDTTICLGQTARLAATGTGGYSPTYLYSWNNGVGNGNIRFITPDTTRTYEVIFSDNCTVKKDTGYVTVNVRPALKITPRSDTTICKGQSVNLFAGASGGLSSKYHFSWDNGLGTGSNKLITPLTTTTYRIILSDSCSTRPDTGYVTITVRPQLDVTPRTDTTICRGQSVILFAARIGGYEANHFLTWNQGIGITDSIQITPDTTKIYRVILKDNCTVNPDTGFVTITVRSPLKINAGIDTTICIGENIDLVATGAGGYSPTRQITWEEAVNGNTFNVNPITTKTYKVVLSDNCTVKNDTDYVSVFVRDSLKISINPDTLICVGQLVNLKSVASGGKADQYSFYWDNGLDSTKDQVVQPGITTTYRVILEDHCTVKPDTDFITINVRDPLTIAARTDSIICIGQPVNLDATATGGFNTNYSYTWDNGLGNGKTKSISPIITTTYRIILKDNCTVKADTDFVTITVRPELTASAGNDTTICISQTADLFASGTGGHESAHFMTWIGLGAGNLKTVNPVTTTTYKVVLQDACTTLPDTDEVTVFVRPELNVNAGPDTTICYNRNTKINATYTGGNPPAYSYQWDHGSTDKEPLVGPLITQTYRIIFSDNCSPDDTDFITVNVRDPLTITAVNDTDICRNSEITLNAKASGGRPGTWQYVWDSGLGNGAEKTLTPNDTHDYVITVYDGCSDPADDTVRVNVEPKPIPEFIAKPYKVCCNDSITLINTSFFIKDSRFLWKVNKQESSTKKDPSYVFKDPGVYDVSLLITSPLGCEAEVKESNFIQIEALPEVNFDFRPGEDLTIINNKVSFINYSSSNSYTYLWDFGDTTVSTEYQPIHYYRDSGIYLITLKAFTHFGCEAEKSEMLHIDDYYQFYIPTGFSPGKADGINDIFEPRGTGIKNYSVEVFNRWGQVVFRSYDKNYLWNGSLNNNGEALDPGVYIYSISVKDFKNDSHYYKGTITLLR